MISRRRTRTYYSKTPANPETDNPSLIQADENLTEQVPEEVSQRTTNATNTKTTTTTTTNG